MAPPQSDEEMSMLRRSSALREEEEEEDGPEDTLTATEYKGLLSDKEEEIKELKELHSVEKSSLQEALSKAEDSLGRLQEEHKTDKEGYQRQCMEVQKVLGRRENELQASRGIVNVLEQHVERLSEEIKGLKGERDEAQRCLKEAGKVVSRQSHDLGEMESVIHDLEEEKGRLMAQLRESQMVVDQMRREMGGNRVKELTAALEDLEKEKAGLVTKIESMQKDKERERTAWRMEAEGAHERLKGIFKRETASLKDLLAQRERDNQCLYGKVSRLETIEHHLRKEIEEKDKLLAMMDTRDSSASQADGVTGTTTCGGGANQRLESELKAARGLVSALQQSFLEKIKETKAMEAEKNEIERRLHETQRQLDTALAEIKSMVEEKGGMVVHSDESREAIIGEEGEEGREQEEGEGEEDVRALRAQVERLTREANRLISQLDQVRASRSDLEEHLRLVIEEKQGLMNEVNELRSRLDAMEKERGDREKELAAREFMLTVKEREAAMGGGNGGSCSSSRENVLRPVVDNLQRMLVDKIREVKELKALLAGGIPVPSYVSRSGSGRAYEEAASLNGFYDNQPSPMIHTKAVTSDRHKVLAVVSSFLPWLLWVMTMVVVVVQGPYRGGQCASNFNRNKELEELLDLYRNMVGRA